MSIFETVKASPPDPIFGLQDLFKRDPHPNKVDLTVGIFRTKELETPPLRCVKKGEALLHKSENNTLYLPIEGDKQFIEGSQTLVFGKTLRENHGSSLVGIQTLGGTGALRLGGDFLRKEVSKRLYLPDPTWPNHYGIFESAQMEIVTYPYYHLHSHSLDFENMCQTLSKAPEKSVILLHGCCHNPTGCNLTEFQWKTLSSLLMKKGLIPFFDFAYQGFGRGIEEDAWAIRHFANQGHEMLVATSHSKNFGLYGERVGCLSILCRHAQFAQAVKSVLKRIARVSYSNPPCHGARILSTIFECPNLFAMWKEEINAMRAQITATKTHFVKALRQKLQTNTFDFLKNRYGLFSMLGIDQEKVKRLRNQGIYLTANGRLNVTGLNETNLPRVVDALAQVLTSDRL